MGQVSVSQERRPTYLYHHFILVAQLFGTGVPICHLGKFETDV